MQYLLVIPPLIFLIDKNMITFHLTRFQLDLERNTCFLILHQVLTQVGGRGGGSALPAVREPAAVTRGTWRVLQNKKQTKLKTESENN